MIASARRANQVVGILLAAGKGTRFDPTGAANKLMQPLANGDVVVAAAAKNLLAAMPQVLAVVRHGNGRLATCLRDLGCDVTECPTAEHGMAASIVHAVSRVPDAHGWVIALGDMPYVKSATSMALAEAIQHGADIAVPMHQGRRGNPVAFSRAHLRRLLGLSGDRGARDLLHNFPVIELAVDDPGIHRDIDVMADLKHSG